MRVLAFLVISLASAVALQAKGTTLPVLDLYCSPKASGVRTSSLYFKVDLNTMTGGGRFDVLDMVDRRSNVLIVDGLTAKKSAQKLSITMKNSTSSISLDVANAEIEALLRGDASKTTFKVTNTSRDIGALDASLGCQMGTEYSITGEASVDASTAAMITDFKVPNTGAAATLYPVRRNLDLGNAQFFCVSVGAHRSYHIDWPARSYCEITVSRLLMPDGTAIARVTGADAKTLAASLPSPSMKFSIDRGSDGFDKIPRSEFAIDCGTPGVCIFEIK